MRNPHHPNTRAEEAAGSDLNVGTPVSLLFLNAIAKRDIDPVQGQAAHTAMRDALRFGFALEPVFAIQKALAMCTNDHSRTAGAVGFLLHCLEQTEANGASWEVPGHLSPAVKQLLIMPGGLRSSALALLPESSEAEAVTYLCGLVEKLHQAKSFSFDGKGAADSGTKRPAHKLAGPKGGKKSIPAVQHGRVVAN